MKVTAPFLEGTNTTFRKNTFGVDLKLRNILKQRRQFVTTGPTDEYNYMFTYQVYTQTLRHTRRKGSYDSNTSQIRMEHQNFSCLMYRPETLTTDFLFIHTSFLDLVSKAPVCTKEPDQFDRAPFQLFHFRVCCFSQLIQLVNTQWRH